MMTAKFNKKSDCNCCMRISIHAWLNVCIILALSTTQPSQHKLKSAAFFRTYARELSLAIRACAKMTTAGMHVMVLDVMSLKRSTFMKP